MTRKEDLEDRRTNNRAADCFAAADGLSSLYAGTEMLPYISQPAQLTTRSDRFHSHFLVFALEIHAMSYSLIRLLHAPLVIAVLLAGCKDRDDVTDESVEEPAIPANDALRTRIDNAIHYTTDKRQMNTRDQAAWQIVHGLEAFGRKLNIESDGEVVGALDYLFKGNPLKGWVLRPGDKFPDGRTGIVAVLEPGSKTGEGHPDQWLGYLSQCGDVQLDDPLVVGGKTYQVRDLMKQAQWDIYDGMEASWTLMAAATYLPLDSTWQAKNGKDEKDRQWSVERIVRMEAAQPLGTGGCFGSHRLYALALAVNRYMKETGKTPEQLKGGWLLAQERINEAIKKAKEFQGRDGTLSTGFFTSPGGAHDLKSRMYAAGHTLEFLVAALPRNELEEPWATLAVDRLLNEFEQTKGLDVECGTLYHGAHALILYRDARWGK
jgi:hypothetical protein